MEREVCIVGGYCSVHRSAQPHYKDTGEPVTKRPEPRCVLNHEAQRRNLTENRLPATPCPACGWEVRPREVTLIEDDGAAFTCGVTSGSLTCDREPGHSGQHRGYQEEHDVPLFWSDPAPQVPARALAPEQILRLGALTLQEEQSEAVERLLTEQQETYQQVLRERGPTALVEALLARDRQLAQMGRAVADGRTAGRLLREFMRAALQRADYAQLRAVGDATKTGKIEEVLELLGAEPADARQLKIQGSTLGPLASPEEQERKLREAGVVYARVFEADKP